MVIMRITRLTLLFDVERMSTVFLGVLVIMFLQKADSRIVPCSGYVCGDGSCVNGTRCDGVTQCADGSDELRCERQSSCSFSQFRCSPGSPCISRNNMCNRIRDCDDGSDEEGCCYRCFGYDTIIGGNGQICSRLCNGITECDDGSDERDCPARNIPVVAIAIGSVVCGLLYVIGCPAAIIFIIVYSMCSASKRQRNSTN